MVTIPAEVEAFLSSLAPERRAVMERLRALVLEHLPEGYEEAVRWGMLSYEVPLSRHPDTYNGQPLMYVAIAAQKQHYAVYLTGVYVDADAEQRLRERYAAAEMKLDLGKSCLRFRRPEQLEEAALAEAVATFPPDAFIAAHARARGGGRA